MAANTNFSIKVTLDEANVIREALRDKRDKLMEDVAELSESDRHMVGAIDTLLRRDFG